MPRFYFHIRESDILKEDRVGLDLPSVEAALIEAEHGARGFVAEAVETGRGVDHQQFEVTDDSGTLLLVYPFSSVIRRTPD